MKGRDRQNKAPQNNNNNNNNKPSKNQLRNQKKRAAAKRKAKFANRNEPGDNWSSVKQGQQPIYKQVQNLVESMVLQDKPYILPRPAGTYVTPHQISFNKEYFISSEDIANGKGRRVFKYSMNPEQLLSIGEQSSITFEDKYPAELNLDGTYDVQDTPIYFNAAFREYADAPFHSTPVYSSTLPQGIYYVLKDGSWVPRIGIQGYSLQFISADAFKQTIVLTNETVASVTMKLTSYNGQGVLMEQLSYTANTAAGTLTKDWTLDPGFSAFQSGSVASAGFTISYSIGEPTRIESLTVSSTSAAFTSSLQWTNYTLWDLVDQSAQLKMQYKTAQLFNPTGLRVLLQNATAQMAKSGFIYGARLPSYSHELIPGSIDGCISFISSQKHHKLRENLLSKGSNYFYTPEKIQDYFFVRPSVADSSQAWPFGLEVVAPSTLDASACILNFNVTISYELITTDISATMFPSASSELLMNQLLYALSKENGWSENPDHLKHAAQVVKNVMTSDEMKFALKSLINTGVKLAPMLVSAFL